MANLSIKPTQMGLAIDEQFAFEQILEIVIKAEEYKNFVRIDMEDSPFIDKTLNLYKKIYEHHKNVGIVIQSYMRRAYDDVVALNKLGTNYRLCKGIYVEPPSIAYKSKQEVRDNYLKLLDKMFQDGNYVGIATHDKYLIDAAYKKIKDQNIPKDKFEFQMLLGVREDLRDKINNDGYKIRIYVPFGKDWYAYSVRRLKENPSMAGHIVKSFLTFGRR
jgi:proline dehydrogenase